MNEVYLMVVELMRNHMFSVMIVFFGLMGCFLGLCYKFKWFDRFSEQIVLGSISLTVALIGFTVISFKKATLEPYSCFYQIDNFRGYNPREYVSQLQKQSQDLQISIDLAKKIQAKNIDELILENGSIQKRIKEETNKFSEYDAFPKKTEFMVLANLSNSYTLLSENKNVITGFELKIKEYTYQNNYHFNQKCSVEITRLAQEQGYLVKN